MPTPTLCSSVPRQQQCSRPFAPPSPAMSWCDPPSLLTSLSASLLSCHPLVPTGEWKVVPCTK
eukprot:2399404-Rhodomonas_salina.1